MDINGLVRKVSTCRPCCSGGRSDPVVLERGRAGAREASEGGAAPVEDQLEEPLGLPARDPLPAEAAAQVPQQVNVRFVEFLNIRVFSDIYC